MTALVPGLGIIYKIMGTRNGTGKKEASDNKMEVLQEIVILKTNQKNTEKIIQELKNDVKEDFRNLENRIDDLKNLMIQLNGK